MKKQEFLSELRTYLNVLQDEEQEDIIDEYSQHIEMKIENGLSEEDAIKDFGSIRELAGEILEAYHVKPGYEKEEKIKSQKKSMKKIKDFFPARSSLGFSAAGIGRKIGNHICSFFGLCIKPFQKIGRLISRKKQKKGVEKMNQHSVLPFIAKKTGNLVHGLFGCFFWCCRMVWNFCILFLSVFSAFFSLVSLFFLGALLVLWMQGYPLGGIVLGIMGAVFCFGSFSVLGSTFIIRKPCQVYLNNEDTENAEKITDKEERESEEEGL